MPAQLTIDSVRTELKVRPVITSYDSGYEHSLEHLSQVQRLVKEADREPILLLPSLLTRASA